jgi:hypothetical protein
MLYEGREERPPIARLPVGAGERRSGALVRWSAGPLVPASTSSPRPTRMGQGPRSAVPPIPLT